MKKIIIKQISEKEDKMKYCALKKHQKNIENGFSNDSFLTFPFDQFVIFIKTGICTKDCTCRALGWKKWNLNMHLINRD